MVDLANIDGNPAEVAQYATEHLVQSTKDFVARVHLTERFIRNAAMSELMEVDDAATPEELIEAWNDSTELRILNAMKEVAIAAVKLDGIVQRYEGYDD